MATLADADSAMVNHASDGGPGGDGDTPARKRVTHIVIEPAPVLDGLSSELTAELNGWAGNSVFRLRTPGWRRLIVKRRIVGNPWSSQCMGKGRVTVPIFMAIIRSIVHFVVGLI